MRYWDMLVAYRTGGNKNPKKKEVNQTTLTNFTIKLNFRNYS